MSNFTTGPWSTGPYDPRFIFDNIGRNIAVVDFVENETLANAHLIAAAPQMYEALANLENDGGTIPDEIWDLVQAALAAAGGE